MQRDAPVPGAFVWIRARRWRVVRVRRQRRVVSLEVEGQAGSRVFLAPFDRPVTVRGRGRATRVRPQRARAIIASLVARSFTVRTLASAVGARLDVLSYQLEPALAFLNGARRILLADDVGLGKTVQAGLVLAELIRRNPLTRALVLAPAGLADQWTGELAERFGISARIADRTSLQTLARTAAHGDTPWRRPGVWVASLDYLKQPHVSGGLAPDRWDLLVIDEAHSACGHSERYDTASALACRARRVLLLTATPHSGDEARFRRLAGLGALDHPEDSLLVFRRTRALVGPANRRRVSWHRVTPSAAESRFLDALRDYERATLSAAGSERRDAALLLLSVFRKRALSTATAAAATIDRRLSWILGQSNSDTPAWIQPSLSFLGDDGCEGSDEPALTADVGLPRARERAWLGRLVALAEAARRDETKIDRLVELVARARESVIVFTEFRASLDVIVRRLSKVRSVAALHGGLTQAERRDALARFERGDASVLASTDVAGQGLNLQDPARWVVSLELPWNPARLEQRFGRVDRIGQKRRAHLTVLVARHQAEDGLLAHLAKRTLAARRALGPETLGAVTPAETHVGAALLAGEALPSSEPPLVRLCERLTRPARAAARVIRRARLLEKTGPRMPLICGTCQTTARTRRWLGIDLAMGGVLVFNVPILDSSGGVLETKVVALQSAALRRLGPLSAALESAAARAACETLNARFRRLELIRATSLQRMAELEAAAAGHLAGQPPREGQPGLFDRREIVELEALRKAEEETGRLARRELESMALPLATGRPALHLILRPPC